MYLLKLAKCIILIWLPLANLDGRKQFRNEKNVSFLCGDDSDGRRTGEKEKEKSTGFPSREKWMEISGKFSSLQSDGGNFSKRFILRSVSEKNFESVEKKSHEVASKFVKRPSALIIDNNDDDNNESAVDLSSYREWKRSKRKLFDSLSISRRRIERKTGIEVSEKAETPEIPESSTPFEYYDEDSRESTEINGTELGSYLGGPCESSCSEKLLHVFCEPKKKICECIEKYPVQIDARRGCEKPKQLGDQCFYPQTCSFFDPNAVCAQINHNAVCQCKPGFHTVALRKGVKKMFCSEDVVVVSADLPTLLGVATGIALLTGLLCFVLRLFSGNRYPAARHYGNANLPPPLLLSGDNQWINGIPLTVQGRSSSRSSCQRSNVNLAQYSRSKGVLVPASRAGAARAAAILLIPYHLQASRNSESEVARNEGLDAQENDLERSSRIGSRRPSMTSIHSTTSSQKSISYSARRFEQENLQREQRAAMKAAREEVVKMATLSPATSPSSTENVLLIPDTEQNQEGFQSLDIKDSAVQTQPQKS